MRFAVLVATGGGDNKKLCRVFQPRKRKKPAQPMEVERVGLGWALYGYALERDFLKDLRFHTKLVLVSTSDFKAALYLAGFEHGPARFWL